MSRGIVLDTSIIIGARRKPVTEEDKERARRCRILLKMLREENARIIFPSVCLAEFLAGIDLAQHVNVMAEFAKYFHLAPFDAKAAATAARIWITHKSMQPAEQVARRQLKVDVMVIATAVNVGAAEFYVIDQRCRNLASHFVNAPELPTHEEKLWSEDDPV